MPESTLTTTTPDGTTTTRPVAPSWNSIAENLPRWQMALVPHHDGTWDVLCGFVDHWRPHLETRNIPWVEVPDAIAQLAARCAADAAEKGEGEG